MPTSLSRRSEEIHGTTAKATPVSQETIAAFRAAAEAITRNTMERALAYPDEVAQHGQDAPKLLYQGLLFTTKGLETALAFHTFDLLADQLRWGLDRLQHHGVDSHHVLHRLQLYRDAVTAELPAEQANEVNAYVQWMIDFQRSLMSAQP